jgi:epoxyqueuosine reductase QueG
MKDKDNDTKEIEEFLKKKDIEIFGFANVNDSKYSVPEDFSPKNTLKDANSIICYAVPIPKGVIYSESNDNLLFWRYSAIAYRNLDNISNSLSIFLEDQGYISTPINGCFPWKVVNREYWGLLPLVYWADQAGLGKLTKCGLLGNMKYGTRLLIGGVLTSKSFNNSELIKEEICPEDCFKCVEICPVKAIDQKGKVNHDLCMRTANKNPIMSLIMNDSELRKTFDFEAIMNTVGVDDHSTYECIECLKACPLNKK